MSRVRHYFIFFGPYRDLVFVCAWIACKDEDARTNTRTVPCSLAPSLGLFLWCFNWSLGSLMQWQGGHELLHCRCTHGKTNQEKTIIHQISLWILHTYRILKNLIINTLRGETLYTMFSFVIYKQLDDTTYNLGLLLNFFISKVEALFFLANKDFLFVFSLEYTTYLWWIS